MNNQVHSYDAELAQHMQGEAASEFFRNTMVDLNAHVGADINAEWPEALERWIAHLEKIQDNIENPDITEAIDLDESPGEYLDWACDDLVTFLRWALEQRVSPIGCRIPAQKAYTGRFWDEDWDTERFMNAPKRQGPKTEAAAQQDAALPDAVSEEAVEKPHMPQTGYEVSNVDCDTAEEQKGYGEASVRSN